MTDLETFKAMLDRAGIKYTEHDRQEVSEFAPRGEKPAPGTRVKLEADEPHPNPKVDGYNGFFTTFSFAPDGSLAKVGVWE